MLYILLIALAAIAILIFAVPVRCKVWVALAAVASGAVASVVRAVEVLSTGGVEQLLWYVRGGVGGVESLSMDGLSALFVVIISIATLATLLYSRGYLAQYLDKKSSAHTSLHYTALVVLYFSMIAVVTASGGFIFLFAWELMTISSFVLILFDAERKEVVRAAIAYLIMMHIGFVFLLIGFVTLWSECGSADFAALTPYFAQHAVYPLFAIFLIGFGMKAGIFPMHVWLPEAHPAAPSHVSAVMSGVMIKTGVYGVLRVVSHIAQDQALYTVGVVLLAVGIVTGLWGVILAATQNDVKRLLAYSSIENIGVIFIGIGVAAIGKSDGSMVVALCGICGALLHTANHSFFKSLLFFGAGNLYSRTHTTSIDSLGGVARSMPVTAILFLVGCVAISALPPLNGFVSEFAIYLGIFDSIADGGALLTSALALIALSLIGGIVVLAFTKLYGTVFLGSPRSHVVAEAEEVDAWRLAAMALPLACIIFVGVMPRMAMSIVVHAVGFFIPATYVDVQMLSSYAFDGALQSLAIVAWTLIAVIVALYLVRVWLLRRRKVEVGPTWGCGFTAPNVRMQYTGESFSEGLQSISKSLTENVGDGQAVDIGEIFPRSHDFDIHHKDRVGKLFTAWWVEMLHLINERIMRFRTGKINHYILFAFAFLILIFVLSIFDLI